MEKWSLQFMALVVLFSSGVQAGTLSGGYPTFSRDNVPFFSSQVTGPGAVFELAVVQSLLLKNVKANVMLPEENYLQPDKETLFSDYTFSLNQYGGDQKEPQSKNENKSGTQQDKKEKKSQTSQSSPSGSSTTSTSSSTSSSGGENYRLYLERLKNILKTLKGTARLQDQKDNIALFRKVIKKLEADFPEVIKEKGSLISRRSNWKAVLALLTRHYPEEMRAGKLTHIFLDSYDLEELPETLLRKFASILTDRFSLPLDAPEGISKRELVTRLRNIESRSGIKGLIHHYLRHPQSLYSLIDFFMSRLSNMTAEVPEQFAVHDKYGHVTVFSIRKNARGKYRIFNADSLAAFDRREDEQSFSAVAEYVSLALLIALKHLNFNDTLFMFLPPRQGDHYTCLSFALNDLETLVESPMTPGGGYFVGKPIEFKLSQLYDPLFSSVAETLAGIRVNGELKKVSNSSEFRGESGLSVDEFREAFANFALMNLLSGSGSELVRFSTLLRFPSRFLNLTQGRQRLERLLEGFEPAARDRINEVIERTRGILSTSRGEANEPVANLAAVELWMNLNIEHIEHLSDTP